MPRASFLKWAAVKGNLNNSITFPRTGKIQRYFEPFLGSGAVFFTMNQNRITDVPVFLSDINSTLMDLWMPSG